jgi:hypothetical protein
MRSGLNLDHIDLYAGIADARLQVDEFHFGRGIALSRTFAHLSAPFLAGFLPRPARFLGDAAVFEPRSFDIVAQLHIPEEAAPLEGLDRLNTVWWLALLLRLRTTPHLSVVGLSSEPFGGDPRAWRGAGFWPVEAEPRRVELAPGAPAEIALEDLEWVRRCWIPAGRLMSEREDLHKAVRNFDRSCFAPGPADALQLLWASLASLFLPDEEDDGSRLASNLATFLEIPPAERGAFLDGATDLLDARLASLEGATGDLEEPVARTCGLVRQTLTQIFDNGYVPTLGELEAGLRPH